LTGKRAYNFNPLGLNMPTKKYIEAGLLESGFDIDEFGKRVRDITNFSFSGEFVTDADKQKDADTLGKMDLYGNTYYLSDDRFNPLLLDNSLFRHLMSPLKEELTFLTKPFYRKHPFKRNLENNAINQRKAKWYFDATLDDFNLLYETDRYLINSIPSLLEDLKH
jgi:hypothetical protein